MEPQPDRTAPEAAKRPDVAGGNGHTPGDEECRAPADAFKYAASRLGEVREYVSLFLGAKLDGIKLTFRNLALYLVLGIVGGVAGLGLLITATVLLALREAAQRRGHWRLTDCTLVVTLEPCPMCAGAVVNARVPRLVYGCDDPKAGAVRTLYQICENPRLNHGVEVTAGVLAEQCAKLLQTFFQAQRALGKK